MPFASFLRIQHPNHHSRRFLGGMPPRPPWVGFAEVWVQNQAVAKQNNAFFLFFWKRRNTMIPTVSCVAFGEFWVWKQPNHHASRFLGACFRVGLEKTQYSAKQNNVFCFFFCKKKKYNESNCFLCRIRRVLGTETAQSSRQSIAGASPWVGFAKVWIGKPQSSAKQNNAFCFFFWKKKKYHDSNCFLCRFVENSSAKRHAPFSRNRRAQQP
jgi:hypothetical protein